MGYSRKKPNGGLKAYFFEPVPGIFHFFTLPQGNSRQKAPPWKVHRFLLDPVEIPNPKLLEIPHYFFLVTLGNSTSFLMNPWKFHMLFLWLLLEIPYSQPPVCLFFRDSPMINLVPSLNPLPCPNGLPIFFQ